MVPHALPPMLGWNCWAPWAWSQDTMVFHQPVISAGKFSLLSWGEPLYPNRATQICNTSISTANALGCLWMGLETGTSANLGPASCSLPACYRSPCHSSSPILEHPTSTSSSPPIPPNWLSLANTNPLFPVIVMVVGIVWCMSMH